MEANELRVGNIVEKNGVEYVADHVTIAMAHNYKPIPLTPEILEKCFDMSEGRSKKEGYIPTLHDLCAFAKLTDGSICLIFEPFPTLQERKIDRYSPIIKYLHQLQNLYFALTGVELKIEL